MSPTALIADDEPLLAQALQADLARAWPDLRIVAKAAHGEAALQETLRSRPDVCFLDIRMPGMNGIEAAQALAEEWPDSGEPDAAPFPLIVFVTAYDQYALQAFDAAAVDYLLKPVQPARLAQACTRLQALLARRRASADHDTVDPLARAVEQLRGLLSAALPSPSGAALQTAPGGARSNPPDAPLTVIQAGIGQTLHLVPVDEVVYFEAADKYVRMLTAQGEYLIRTPLRELLPRLDAQRFWQVHRGTLVRADAIERAERDEYGKWRLSLRGRPELLRVSRLYAHLFKAM